MKIRTIMLIILSLISVNLIHAQISSDLFISEYVDGTSNQKAIELFNGTWSTVDLSQYSLKKQSNGNGTFGYELTLSGILSNADCYVIAFNSSTGTSLANQSYVDLAITSNVMNFNGNDCLGLFKNGILLDVIGVVDQNSPWGQDVTLRRNPDVLSPVSVWNPNEWTTYPVDTFDDLGLHMFAHDSPTVSVITPNGGESWEVGTTHTITWADEYYAGMMKITLLQGTVATTIINSTIDSHSFEWTIPSDLTVGSDYRIKVSCFADTDYCDISDNTFSIVTPDANDEHTSELNASILYNNVPNPFTISTSIRFDAKSNKPVTIEIYNIRGKKVAIIMNNELIKGYHTVIWNGRDSKGIKAPSGIYLYKMQSGIYSSTKKMILMK
jgi:uncharacterized protein